VKALIAVFTFMAALVVIGCQTVPKVSDPSGVDVTVTGLTDQKVMIYYGQGAPFEPDPYIPPSLLLSGHTDAYVVVRIEVASIRKALITLDDAQAMDATGTVVAHLLRKADFLDLLRRQGADEQLLGQLDLKVERTYFPDAGWQTSPGKRAFAAVLVATAPLKPPLTVNAQLTVDGGAPRAFQVPWTN